MELIDGNLKVEFTYIGEGLGGEYNEDDPEDEPLLRFYVSALRFDDPDGPYWEDLDHGSYCTLMPTYTPEKIQYRWLEVLMRTAKDTLEEADGSFKRRMEELSWMDGKLE